MTVQLQSTPDETRSVLESLIPPHLNWEENVLFRVLYIYHQVLFTLIPERMIGKDMWTQEAVIRDQKNKSSQWK